MAPFLTGCGLLRACSKLLLQAWSHRSTGGGGKGADDIPPACRSSRRHVANQPRTPPRTLDVRVLHVDGGAEALGVPGDVVREDDGPHGGLAAAALPHQQHLPLHALHFAHPGGPPRGGGQAEDDTGPNRGSTHPRQTTFPRICQNTSWGDY